ncbi:DUF4349 domain-containing protein [Demequina mangrovi]|nr:DUF4349 domain-containing protein [Demequina mangrovi]
MSTRVDANSRPLRRGAVVASILALAWALAGCSSSAEDSGGEADSMGYAGREEAAVAGDAMADEAAETEDLGGDGAADSDRAIIVTGSMYMTVEDPIAAADRAASLVEGAGGRVDARSETAATEYDGGAAWLTLRIPANGLDSMVDRLRGLGTVDEFSTDSADVTQQVTDLEAQISTLRASTARIEGLLAEASSIRDIITLEDELDSRQSQLESLEARQRGLDDQVSMSTIDLSLTTEPVVIVDDSPHTFGTGLASGWNGLVAFLGGALVIAGVLLPWLVTAGIVATVVLLAVRASKDRKRRAAAATTAEQAPPEEAVPAGGPSGRDD